jgi:hypothetical protein
MSEPTSNTAWGGGLTADDARQQFQQPPAAAQPPVYRSPAALDLDALEREGAAAQPFDFILGGKRYMMSDPQNVDWQQLISVMNNPHMFFRTVLPPEDHRTFFDAQLPSWKMRKLMDEYQAHYGIPSLPNAGGLPR